MSPLHLFLRADFEALGRLAAAVERIRVAWEDHVRDGTVDTLISTWDGGTEPARVLSRNGVWAIVAHRGQWHVASCEGDCGGSCSEGRCQERNHTLTHGPTGFAVLTDIRGTRADLESFRAALTDAGFGGLVDLPDAGFEAFAMKWLRERGL